MPNCATPILIPRIHVAALVLVDEASCEVLEDLGAAPAERAAAADGTNQVQLGDSEAVEVRARARRIKTFLLQ